jgi:hypothetical protein
MIVTVFVILAIAALITAVAAAMSRAPLWVSVIILCLIELIRALPMGK